MLSGIGEVFTERIQGKCNVGAGVFDPEKVPFVEDANGKVVIDGKLCSVLSKPAEPVDPTAVTIGDHVYHWVEWNGLKVLTEDLIWDVGTYYVNANAPEPIGFYYANTISNVTTITVALRNAGLSEWRIPKPADWTRLINEPTITLPTTEKYERERGITKLLSDDPQFRSVFPYHEMLNASGIGLNPNRIATSTAKQFDRANYMEDADSAHNVVMRYYGGYTVVTANYGSTAGACIRLVSDI